MVSSGKWRVDKVPRGTLHGEGAGGIVDPSGLRIEAGLARGRGGEGSACGYLRSSQAAVSLEASESLTNNNQYSNMNEMIEAGVNEFPFVEGLAKRDKTKLENLWEVLKRAKELADEKGMLLPSRFAAGLLGVSQQRVDQLMDAGKLERVVLDGHPFITEDSIVDYAKSERKTGRPIKICREAAEKGTASAAWDFGKEVSGLGRKKT